MDLNDAIVFAVRNHADQKDKLGQPYIYHPLRVMLALQKQGAGVALQIAGVLHDVVEDTDATLEEVEEVFGPKVAELVDAVSRRKGETYRQFVERVAQHSAAARLLKRADILDNLSRPTPIEMQGIERRYRSALAILDAVDGLV